MFGYVAPIEGAMEQEDERLFRAYYCGTCKQMGKIARMALSYDCAFLAAVRASCGPEEPMIQARCPAHPLQKREMVVSDNTQYAADINVLLAYYDLCDKIQDGAGRAVRAMRFVLRPKAKKLQRRYPALDQAIRAQLALLDKLQREKSCDVDGTADTFAQLLQQVAAPGADRKGPLGRLFYNVGRWIYLQDAITDFEQDQQEGQYNVLVNRYGTLEQAQAAMDFSLWHTLAEASICMRQLNPAGRLRGVIEHILWAALPEKTKAALDQQGGDGAESV